jgi:hypothetical protein
MLRKVIPAAVAAMLCIPATVSAKQTGTDWLWLSARLDGCTWTVTVNWAGYKDSKYLEVFTTEGYAGAPIVSTVVQIQNKDNTATVTLPPLAASATATYFYPWAQLLDVHGAAIPSSLDFSGQNLGYCTAP